MKRVFAAALALGMGLATAPVLAQEDASPAARAEEFARLPYWPGYWVSEYTAGTTISGLAPAFLEARERGTAPPVFDSLNGGQAPWNEEGRRRWTDLRARAPGLKATGWGFPMMMNAATPIQFLVTPEEVLIINAYNEARHVYMNRPMFDEADLWPTVLGTSVGRWEGDTLVIETIMVANPSEYFHGAPPLSEEARYVERIRMDGDRLVSDVTIEDPTTLTEPWTAQVTWLRDEGFDRMIQIDWDNDRTGVGEDGVNTIEQEVVE
jgi:hypothetical protein